MSTADRVIRRRSATAGEDVLSRLLAQNRPLAAAPYFQLVLDRYTSRNDSRGFVVFASIA